MNIASLNKHIDDLRKILSQLKYNFDIIGISEHKILKGTTPSNNIEIPGYDNFILEPTDTNFGDTGFYVKDNLDYVRRSDLEINSPTNYETIVIEVKFPKKKNLIVGCIYRHPSSKISLKDFTNLHLSAQLKSIGCLIVKLSCIYVFDVDVSQSAPFSGDLVTVIQKYIASR